jgi:membrane-bound ClpP family serine protease
MFGLRAIAIFAVLILLFPCMGFANEVYTIKIQGAITPPTASYIRKRKKTAPRHSSSSWIPLEALILQ